jgi:hypothetical protein
MGPSKTSAAALVVALAATTPACGPVIEGGTAWQCTCTLPLCTDPPAPGECGGEPETTTFHRLCGEGAPVAECAARCPTGTTTLLAERPEICSTVAPLTMGTIDLTGVTTMAAPAESWIVIQHDGDSAVADITPSSTITLRDSAGEGAAGELAFTNLEIYGDPVVISGATVQGAIVLGHRADTSGHKLASGHFVLDPDTFLTATAAQVDGDYMSLVGYPTGILDGELDYDDNRLTFDGDIEGRDRDGNVLVTAAFHLVFYFGPGDRPPIAVGVPTWPAPGRVSLSGGGSYDPLQEPIVAYHWHWGRDLLPADYLDQQRIIGHGKTVKNVARTTDWATLQVVTASGRRGLRPICVAPKGC